MLPMTDIREESGGKIETKNLILYEPDGETVFDAIVPEYLAGLVYGGICESTASELAARRMAMVNVAWKKPDGCQPLTGDSDETNVEDMLAVSAILLAKEGKKEAEV